MASIKSTISSGLKAAREIPSRRRVGNALGSQTIEKAFILAPQFNILQPHSSGHDVIGHVQNMIALVIGQMPLKHLNLLIERIDQPNLLGQQMNRSNASTAHGLGLLGHLVDEYCSRLNIGFSCSGHARGFRRRAIRCLRFRRILGYFLLTRNVLFG